MQVIFLIRHGESEWNRDGKIQGFRDSGLSELGKRQAVMLGRRLAGERLDHVVTSTASRAIETCRLALESFPTGLPVERSSALREINLGSWEGVTASEIKKRYPGAVKMWFERPSKVRIEGAETLKAFRLRVVREMNRIREEHEDQSIAVFTHGGAICAYLTGILRMKLDDLWRFKIRNGSITKVIFPQNKPRVELLGDVSHLDGAVRSDSPRQFRMFP